MKLIAFALAAIAFTGSSRAKDKAENTPAEPEKPKAPSNPPAKTPQLPLEDAVRLSEQEKADPINSFGDLKKKYEEQKNVLIGAKKRVMAAKWKLVANKQLAEEAQKATKAALQSFTLLNELDEQPKESEKPNKNQRKAETEAAKKFWKKAQEKEEKANQTVAETAMLVSEAQKAFNEELDKALVADHELRSKGPLLVQRANEIAELQKQKADEAKESVAESKKAVQKQQNILDNLPKNKFDLSPEALEKTREEAGNKKEAEAKKLDKAEEVLGVAQAKSAKASEDADALKKKLSSHTKDSESFRKSNQRY